MIDITCTATRRPEILDKTLASFKKNMFHDRPCCLIINVDPVGDDILSSEIFALASEYFPRIVYRSPDEANFPQAFIWTWTHATSDFVFHLEDDWELLVPIDLDAMLAKMKEIPDLMGLRLHWRRTEEECKPFARTIPYNAEDGFFEPVEAMRNPEGICGHPTLFRHKFISTVLPYMTLDKNPEKQLRYNKHTAQVIREHRWGIWGKQFEPPQIRDLGRAWIADSGWRKAGSRAFFKKWEKIPIEETE